MRDWIRANSISVPAVDAPLSPAEAKTLDLALRGKRVVFLGEAAHWVHEKYDYRLRFLQYLIGKGFTHVGMEMGLSDGRRIDVFLNSGNRSDLERVALYGHRGPGIRRRRPAGGCPLGDDAHPVLETLFNQEEAWFYSQLRSIGKAILRPDERVRHFGYDVDMIPGGAYEDIARLLKDQEDIAEVSILKKRLAIVEGETLDEEISRLEGSLDRLDSRRTRLQTVLGEQPLAEARLSLKTLIRGLKFESVQLSRPCSQQELPAWTERLMGALAEREAAMFEIVGQRLNELGPKGKIVLMGHNFHLGKEPNSLWFTDVSQPEDAASVMWPSIGEYLARRLKGAVYSIWMIQNQGSQSDIVSGQLECPVETGPDYIGATLSDAGSFFSLPNPANEPTGYFDRRLDFSVNDGTSSGRFGKNADMIFYVDRVSGLRPR